MPLDITWTDDPLYDDTPVKSVHIQELQKYVNIEEEARGLTKTTFTTIEQDSVVKASDLIEIKNAIDNIRQYDTGSPFTWDTDWANLQYSDIETNERGSGVQGCSTDTTTPPAIQVEELRRKLEMVAGGCSCNCNYSCTCYCNYCTCKCNYCTCKCNYSCTCYCNYYCTCKCDNTGYCECESTNNTGD